MKTTGHSIAREFFGERIGVRTAAWLEAAVDAALFAARAEGRAAGVADAAQVAGQVPTWVEENSYAAQVDLRARIVAAIEGMG